jgi:hypothetical protein
VPAENGEKEKMEGLGRRTFDNEENGKNRKKKRARAHTSSVNDELDNLKEHWGRSFYRFSSTFYSCLPSFSLGVFLLRRSLINRLQSVINISRAFINC